MPDARALRAHVHYQLCCCWSGPAGWCSPACCSRWGCSCCAATAIPARDLVAGLTVLGALSTAYLTHAAGLVTARESGVLRRWRASPLPPWAFFTGRMAATTLTAVAGAGGHPRRRGPAYHVGPGPAGVVNLLVVLVVGTLCVAAWAPRRPRSSRPRRARSRCCR